MDNYFKNKVIWITGASSGIGEALAYAFSFRGAKLILSSRSYDELDRVKHTCRAPENVKILTLDLSDISSLLPIAKLPPRSAFISGSRTDAAACGVGEATGAAGDADCGSGAACFAAGGV